MTNDKDWAYVEIAQQQRAAAHSIDATLGCLGIADAFNHQRSQLLNAIDTRTPLDRKRTRALEYLGSNWVLHRSYRPNRRHSNDLETWASSLGRRTYLAHISERAAEARANNPFFQPTQE